MSRKQQKEKYMIEFETGYINGYSDAFAGREYEDETRGQTSNYLYGYSCGYEDGVYREEPEYKIPGIDER